MSLGFYIVIHLNVWLAKGKPKVPIGVVLHIVWGCLAQGVFTKADVSQLSPPAWQYVCVVLVSVWWFCLL